MAAQQWEPGQGGEVRLGQWASGQETMKGKGEERKAGQIQRQDLVAVGEGGKTGRFWAGVWERQV